MVAIDEAELVRRYRLQGDTAARDELVMRMLPLVRHLAMRYAHRGAEIEDLIQVGSVGLLKAIERFDPERGTKLATYVEPTVLGEIKRYFRDYGWAVRPPRSIQEMHARVGRAIDDLSTQFGHTPSAAQVAEYLNVPLDDVLDALHAGDSYEASSLDGAADDSTPQSVRALASTDGALEQAELRVTLADAFDVLEPREREIVRLRFTEDLSQREIGERTGISQMHVSRILRGALKQLRSSLEDSEQAI